MPKLTIVIPTYNVEAYIAKCLDSLVLQTSQDFEALVIIDGSPAHEKKIVEPYTLKYKNFKMIEKLNGGYGSVLNTALAQIKTPYFLICDPDDYLREDTVDALIQLMEQNQVDLVVGAKELVYSDNAQTQYDPSFNPDFAQLKDGQIYVKGTTEFDQLFFMEPSPHAKLYKTELIKHIQFPEKVSYTDNLLFYMGLLNAEKVVYTQVAYSYYLINREGNTRTDLRPNVMDAWISVMENVLDQSKKLKNIPDMFYYRMFESFKFIFNKIDFIQADEDVLKQKLYATQNILNRLLNHRQEILPIYQRLSQSMGKERHHDLDLLNPKTSQQRFRQLADSKLLKRSQGPHAGLKGKFKVLIQTHPLLSKIYDIYHEQAKYIYAAKNPKINVHPSVSSRLIDPQGQTFYGYYNRSPYRNGHYVYHRLNSNSLSLKQTVEICLDGEVISQSKAWNWQQGTLLQWLDDSHIIHNVFEDHHYQSRIINIETKAIRKIDYPIYSVSQDGTFALSLNFSRLAKYRPDYGYFNLPYQSIEAYDQKDGIFYVDLVKNTQKLVISFKTLLQFEPKESMKEATHKVNHIDISPNDQAFIFLHRWIKDGKKYTRLIKADLKTFALTVMAHQTMVSHCYWMNDAEIIGYLSDASAGDRYYLLNNNSKQQVFKSLVYDGHPSYSKDEKMFITDSYPDYTCTSKLYFSKTPFNQLIELGRFYSGRKYVGTQRCDLHPRFSPDKNEITLDTVYRGKRQLIALDIEKLVK